jgi:hypothetical protein
MTPNYVAQRLTKIGLEMKKKITDSLRVAPESVPKPWDCQEDESLKAYGAFLVYRDQGTAREVVQSYREFSGRREAKQAPGYFITWYTRHRWKARALAWDRRDAELKSQATERAIAQSANEWVKRRDKQSEIDYRLAQRFLEQSAEVAAMGLVKRTISSDGKTTIMEAVDSKDMRNAVVIAQAASALAWNAIHQQLYSDIDADFDPKTATTAELRAFLDRKGRASGT